MVQKCVSFKNEFVKLSSSVCRSGVYKIEFRLLDPSVKEISGFGDISIFDASGYESFSVYVKMAYRWSCWRRPTRMQERVTLIGQQRRREQHTLSPEVRRCSQSLLHRRFFKSMEEGDGLLRMTWTVYLIEIVKCVINAVEEEERNENVATLLSMIAKHDIGVLTILAKESLQDQSCATSFRSVHLYVSGSVFVAGWYISCLEDYVEETYVTHDRPELRNQVHLVLACENFEPNIGMQNSFVLTSGDSKERSVLWLRKLQLRFRLNYQADSDGTEHVFLLYTTCIFVLQRVDIELGCVSLR